MIWNHLPIAAFSTSSLSPKQRTRNAWVGWGCALVTCCHYAAYRITILTQILHLSVILQFEIGYNGTGAEIHLRLTLPLTTTQCLRGTR